MISANILRNSVQMARNFNSKFDRFKVEPKGGLYANTMAVNNGF